MAAKNDNNLDLALPAEMLQLGELLTQKGPLRFALEKSGRAKALEEAQPFIDGLLNKVCVNASACRIMGLRRNMGRDTLLIRMKVIGVLGWQALRLSVDLIEIGDLAAAVADAKQPPTEALLRARHVIGVLLSEDRVLGTSDGDGPYRRVKLPSLILEWLSGGKSSMGSVTLSKLVGLGTLPESVRDVQRKQEPQPVLTPKQLFEAIRTRVIGLDEQAKLLAGRLCLHVTRSKLLRAGKDPGTMNECWGCIGPPGVGKTTLCEVAGSLSGTTFATADASDLTCDGYVGLAFSDTLRFLLMAANGDVEKARFGFLALDEFMKKARSMGESAVTTTGVQQEALRVISGQTMMIGGRRGWDRPLTFNTVGTCFALLGHCPGLDKIIEKKMGSRALGFSPSVSKSRTGAWLMEALLDFGLIEELVSRLTAIIVIPPPSMETLLKAVNSEHGIVASFNRLLAGHEAMLLLEDSAVLALAEYGMESGSFFRGMKRAISTLAGEIAFAEEKGTVTVSATDIKRVIEKADGNAADLLRHG